MFISAITRVFYCRLWQVRMKRIPFQGLPSSDTIESSWQARSSGWIRMSDSQALKIQKAKSSLHFTDIFHVFYSPQRTWKPSRYGSISKFTKKRAYTSVRPSIPLQTVLNFMPETTWQLAQCKQQLTICGCRLASRASPRCKRGSLELENFWNPPGISSRWLWLPVLIICVSSPDIIQKLDLFLPRHPEAVRLLLPMMEVTRGLMPMNSPGACSERVAMTEMRVSLACSVKQTSCRENGFVPLPILLIETLLKLLSSGQERRRYSMAFCQTDPAAVLVRYREARL